MYPKEYLYSHEHEWVHVDGDVATVGITEFAQQELGDVVFVDLPGVGDEITAQDEVGTIESVKAVAELYTPVSGEVVEVNEAAVDDPEVLNEDPHAEGWLLKVKLANADELASLMDAGEYEEMVEGKGEEDADDGDEDDEDADD